MTKFNKKGTKQNSKNTLRSKESGSKSKKFGRQSKFAKSKGKVTDAKRKGKRFDGKFKRNKKEEEDDEIVEVVSEKGDNLNYNKKDEESDSQNSDEEIMDTRKMLVQQNKKNKKSGGFQSMGLSHPVYTAIIRKGYKVPTPIQRKTIPLILDGKDMVAMARTGSGKTAAFLIPLFEKLKTHSAKSGARALIMSPTRELALQTLKFSKELGKFTSLRAAVVLGGDRMEDQFAALHENPDIIIATPGRFLHIVVEMDLKLRSIEYVVFDEADRLFEMGFQEQLTEVLQRLPESRQTLLFSATLPKLLVNFAKAGLHDPTLIRLDVDTKLSDQLKIVYLSCRADDKAAILLHLLQNVISAKSQTVVFAATKHHVEYLYMLLTKADINCTYIYSSLDQTARKINIGKFQHRRALVMVVTDLAARGIDIPMLDNVINYHFPAKPKLFVHRVGRVARAGRSGTAYSLVSSDEVAHLLDLHLFLSRPLKLAERDKSNDGDDGLYGEVPQTCIDDRDEYIHLWHRESVDLTNMKRVCANAFKNYVRSRPAPASESIKRYKQMTKGGIKLGVHPIFQSQSEQLEDERGQLLTALKGYKVGNTIFEINSTSKTKSMAVMKEIRSCHSNAVMSYSKRKEEAMARLSQEAGQRSAGQDIMDQEELQGAFSTVIGGKKQRPQVVDEENYLHYRPSDYQTEKGLNISTTFEKEAEGAILDLTGDDEKKMRQLRTQMKWDRKRKRFIHDSGNDTKTKMFRTESGVWIKSSYKSNAYRDWSQKNKTSIDDDDDDDNKNGEDSRNKFTVVGRNHKQWHTKGADGGAGSRNRHQFKHGKQERKSTEQIFKTRQKKEKQEMFQKKRQHQKQKRRTFSSQMKAKNKK